MIRPFTCICMLLAGGSGLYLYQTKHRTRMLDRQIEQTVKQAEVARSRIGLLQAEWALLNEPQRLAELGDRFLNLKSVAPTQFVTLSELDQHLPAPLPPPAPPVAISSAEEPAEPAQPAAEGASPLEAAQAAAAAPVHAEPTRPEPARTRPAAPVRAAMAASPAHPPAPASSTRGAELLAAAHRAPRREAAAQLAQATGPIPLIRPAVVTPVLAMATPRPRVARMDLVAPASSIEPPPPASPMASSAPPITSTGSLLGGVHAAMAPPVASGAAWPRSR